MASVLPSDIAYFGSASMPGFDGSTTITAAITTTTATTMAVTANASFPQTGEFPVFFNDGSPEIVWVTQGAGTNTWTIIRGMFGTTAATHLINAAVTSGSGGAIDFLTGVAFTDVGAGDTVDIISSSASDTHQIISVAGRDTAGNFISGKTGTLNGQTAVTGVGSAQTFNRILYVGMGQLTTIATTALTASTTNVTVASGANIANTNLLLMGREIVSVTSGGGTASLVVVRAQGGTVGTTHQVGDSVYLLPAGDVAVYDHTNVVSGTMQSGSAQSTGTTPAIAKLQSGQGGSVSIGQIILTTGGTGPHQIRTIIAVTGYGTDVVAVDRDWDTLTDATTTYTVNKGWKLPFKMGSGVGSTVAVQLTNIQRFLWGAIANVPGGGTNTYYEKIFAVNQNTTTDLTAANIQVLSNSPALPGSALLDMAITNSVLNDNFVAANRTTLPTAQGGGALTFVTQPGAINLTAGSGALTHSSGAASATQVQGVWLRTTIPAGTAAYNGAADIRTVGNTI